MLARVSRRNRYRCFDRGSEKMSRISRDAKRAVRAIACRAQSLTAPMSTAAMSDLGGESQFLSQDATTNRGRPDVRSDRATSVGANTRPFARCSETISPEGEVRQRSKKTRELSVITQVAMVLGPRDEVNADQRLGVTARRDERFHETRSPDGDGRMTLTRKPQRAPQELPHVEAASMRRARGVNAQSVSDDARWNRDETDGCLASDVSKTIGALSASKPSPSDFTAGSEPAESHSLKRCSWCYQDKPATAFYRGARMCKTCAKVYSKMTKQIRERGLALVRT